jgi:hypothetical protein
MADTKEPVESLAELVARSEPHAPAKSASQSVELYGRIKKADSEGCLILLMPSGQAGAQHAIEIRLDDVIDHGLEFEDSSGVQTHRISISPDATVKYFLRAGDLVQGVAAAPQAQAQAQEVYGFIPKPNDPKGLEPKQFDPKRLEPKQFDPKGLEPKQFDPKGLEPKQFDPKGLEPKQFDPKRLEPKQFDPKQFEPKQFDPKQFEPKQLDPKQFEPKQFEPKRADPGPWEQPWGEGVVHGAASPLPYPKQLDPKQLEPKQFDPKQLEPKQLDPKQFEPKQLDPKQLEPKRWDPKQLEPKRWDPKQLEPKGWDAMPWDPSMGRNPWVGGATEAGAPQVGPFVLTTPGYY